MESYRFDLVYTTDLHATMLAHDYGDNREEAKGLVRLASYLKTKNHPYLLMDNGDTIQGSPLMDCWLSGPMENRSPVAITMNQLGYDYVTLGNHDFNYGPDPLARYIMDLNAPVLCANVVRPDGSLLFSPYAIHTLDNGIKIGIIGVVTQYIPHWEKPQNISGFRFLDAYDTVMRYSQKLRDQVDALVVLYHGGLEKDLETGAPQGRQTDENEGYAIAHDAPIDVLFAGHQHIRARGMVQGTLVLQTAAEGRDYGEVELRFERESEDHPWRLVAKDGEIHANDFPMDEEILSLLAPYEAATQAWLDEPLGTLAEGDMLLRDPFLARLNQHPLFDLMNTLQLEASNADVSSTSFANVARGLEQNITMRDLVATFLYPNTLFVIEVTGTQLKEAMERSASYFRLIDGQVDVSPSFVNPKAEHYNYDVFGGVEYTIDLTRPTGQRITSLTRQGIPVSLDESLRLVTSNYRAIGGGDYTMFYKAPILTELPVGPLDLLRDYCLKMKRITPPPTAYQILR